MSFADLVLEKFKEVMWNVIEVFFLLYIIIKK